MPEARESQRTEKAMSGQIVVIFALMITVILGFTGMAIDLAHARGVAEDAQRAADAGALAGVVYLPGSTSNATAAAAALSAANNFTDTCTVSGTCGSAGSIQIQYQPDGPNRKLREQVTEWVPTTFLKILGLGSIAVSRSATASYADPVTLGAPDHVLGFAPYPTKAVQLCTGTHVTQGTDCQSYNPYGQGFFLEVRGPWTGVENGDAFSANFEEFNGSLHTTSGATPPSLSGCTGADPGSPVNNICQNAAGTSYHLVANPMYNLQDTSSTMTGGYNYVVAFPPKMTSPALIKLLDPYDECFTSGGSPPNATVLAPNGPSNNAAAVSQQVSGQKIDQCGSSPFSSTSYPTTLRFTISEPTDQLALADRQVQASSGVDLNGSMSSGSSGWQVTTASSALGGSQQLFGADPAKIGNKVPPTSTSSHGWEWFTFAQFQNNTSKTQYVRLNVASVQNADGSSGTGGNDFALGVCKSDLDTSAADIGNQTDPSEWQLASTNGTIGPTNGYGSPTGVDLGCADPNIGTNSTGAADNYGCSDGTNTCYFLSALNSFCLETLQQSAGLAIIPLAKIDQHFDNSDITLRLYDAGDISGSGDNLVNILGPNTDPGGTTFQSFGLDLSAPLGSGYSKKGGGRTPGGTPNGFFGNTSNGVNSCSPDYNAYTAPAAYPDSNGAICPPLTALQAGNGNNTGVYPDYHTTTNQFGNGTWMDFHIHVPSSYRPTADDQWWKVLYNTTSGATDTTTWQVESGAAPVHLVSVS